MRCAKLCQRVDLHESGLSEPTFEISHRAPTPYTNQRHLFAQTFASLTASLCLEDRSDGWLSVDITEIHTYSCLARVVSCLAASRATQRRSSFLEQLLVAGITQKSLRQRITRLRTTSVLVHSTSNVSLALTRIVFCAAHLHVEYVDKPWSSSTASQVPEGSGWSRLERVSVVRVKKCFAYPQVATLALEPCDTVLRPSEVEHRGRVQHLPHGLDNVRGYLDCWCKRFGHLRPAPPILGALARL